MKTYDCLPGPAFRVCVRTQKLVRSFNNSQPLITPARLGSGKSCSSYRKAVLCRRAGEIYSFWECCNCVSQKVLMHSTAVTCTHNGEHAGRCEAAAWAWQGACTHSLPESWNKPVPSLHVYLHYCAQQVAVPLSCTLFHLSFTVICGHQLALLSK